MCHQALNPVRPINFPWPVEVLPLVLQLVQVFLSIGVLLFFVEHHAYIILDKSFCFYI